MEINPFQKLQADFYRLSGQKETQRSESQASLTALLTQYNFPDYQLFPKSGWSPLYN